MMLPTKIRPNKDKIVEESHVSNLKGLKIARSEANNKDRLEFKQWVPMPNLKHSFILIQLN